MSLQAWFSSLVRPLLTSFSEILMEPSRRGVSMCKYSTSVAGSIYIFFIGLTPVPSLNSEGRRYFCDWGIYFIVNTYSFYLSSLTPQAPSTGGMPNGQGGSSFYFTNTFLPLTIFTPFCTRLMRWPARLKISVFRVAAFETELMPSVNASQFREKPFTSAPRLAGR